MRRLLRARLDARADSGVSLPELLVVMTILPIVMGISSVALIQALHLQAKTTMRGNAQSTNRLGLELMTRLLRQSTYPQYTAPSAGPIITDAEDNRLVFTSHAGTGATPIKQYVFELANNNLSYGVAGPTCVGFNPCSYPAPSTMVADKLVVAGVRNLTPTACPGSTTTPAVFHYYALDVNGAPTQLLTTPVPSTGIYNLSSIALVQIDMWTKTGVGGDAPAKCEHITGSVDLRNRQ